MQAGAYGNDASGDGMYDSGYDSDGYLDDGDGAYGTDEKERVFLVGATLKVGLGAGGGDAIAAGTQDRVGVQGTLLVAC